MSDEKAIRAAKLTLGGMLDKRRAKTAKSRAQGQIAPSKYLPDVPRQVHANGGKATFTQGNHPDVPDVVYHGTNGDFTAFRPDGIHWFTSDKMDAADYRPKRIVEAHLSLKNPADLDAPKVKSVLKKGGFDPENLYDLTQSGNAVKSLLMGMGYDGIMVSRPDVDKGVMHYAVFHPHQIKSATDNNGNFDPNNPDITKATGGGVPRQAHAKGGVVNDARVKFISGNHPEVPPVVYHATRADFHEFRPLSHFGTMQAAHDRYNDKWHPAHLDMNHSAHHVSVMPVHISLKNPLDVGPERDWQSNRDTIRQAADSMFKSGRMDQDYLKSAEKLYDLVDDKRWGSDPRAAEQEGANLLREAGHDGIIYTNRIEDPGSRSFITLGPEQVKSAIGNQGTFDPTHPDMTKADGGSVDDDGYTPQKTVKAYKLFRKKGDSLLPLFVNADKPVPMGEWLEAEEGPQGKTAGKVKSKLGDLAYRPGWHAGDLPIATHIGGKSRADLKAPDYRPDDQVWAEVEMADDHDWQSEANRRGTGVKAAITDQVPLRGHYRFKTNPNMTGNWLIGGHMKVNRVLSDEDVAAINEAAGVADLPRLKRADGGPAMFEGMHEDLLDDDGKPIDLWHGTPAKQEFEAFDDAKVGTERDHGFWGRGHYLTPDRTAAEEYAFGEDGSQGTVIGPLHAALKNPYVWDVSDDNASHRTLRDLQSMGIMREKSKLDPWDNLQGHHMNTFMRTMRDRGHDGVLMKTSKERGRKGISEVVVFKPNMIKHKDAEVFDPTDPRIRRANGGKVDLYSRAAQIIRGLKDRPMQVEDIVKYATGKGAKPAEFKHANLPSGKATPSQVAGDLEFFQPRIGVQRLGSHDFRFGDSQSYLDELDRLNNLGRYSEAERLYDEFERFEGYGGQSDPKYAQYQLPGGRNYREHILTLDSHPEDQTYYAKRHWGKTPNPLVHVRMSDRILPDGRKILHVEELQSDWNNDARKMGFRTGTEKADYDAYVAKMRQEMIENLKTLPASDMIKNAMIEKAKGMDPYMLALKMGRQEEHNALARKATGQDGVPQAPYIDPKRDDASEVGLKHILMEAAKGGYHGIAFTPDEAQEARWPGHTFKGIYNKKLPGMAQKLVQQHDPDTDDDMMHLSGWAVPMVPLSDKARDSINQNGFSSFRRGGYVVHERRAR